MNTQPWIRNVELKIGGLPGSVKQVGLLNPVAARLFSDGSLNTPRIKFRINKHPVGLPQPSVIEIYNMSSALRSTLNTLGTGSGSGDKLGAWNVPVILSVGWSNIPMAQIFAGGLMSAWSRRESTDIVTTLGCLSGFVETSTTLFLQGIADGEIGPNSPLGGDGGVIFTLASFFGATITVDPKNINVQNKVTGPKKYTCCGLASDCLDIFARTYGFSWSIIDNVFLAWTDKTGIVSGGTVPAVNAQSGLRSAQAIIDNPFGKQLGVIFETLLDPRINPGVRLNLESVVNPELNGNYFAQTVTHSGDTHSDEWSTCVENTHVFSGLA